MNNDSSSNSDPLVKAVRTPHLIRIGVLAVIVLVLLIPVSMIQSLVSERQERRDSATKEITSKWGGRQVITGPALILPYNVRSIERVKDQDVVKNSKHNAVFLPARLSISGQINQEMRSRGIFAVPVYSASLTIQGEFDKPDIAALGIDAADVEWAESHISLGISDVRALRSASQVTLNGSATELLPGIGGFAESAQGLHAKAPTEGRNSGFAFSIPVSLNGSESLYTVPFARDTVVQLHSNALSPSFQGNWLPTDRTITRDGFDAIWRVSYLGRNYPQMWNSEVDMRKSIEGSQFGIDFSEPIDHYRMVDRSVKYASLFILLTFASIWLVEVLIKAPVHPIQYLMIGAALCVFYLLELSLSEHIIFPIAYGIASLAIVGMVTTYGRTLFRQGQRGFIVSLGVAMLYSYLYVLLMNEDAALLVGSIGLFIILAAIMFLTRRVNWYSEVRTAVSDGNYENFT